MSNVISAPGTVASGGDGSQTWSNPNNAKVEDGAFAQITGAGYGATSDTLRCSNFGFAIYSGATITGIKVGIKRYQAAGFSINDYVLQLAKTGSLVGTNNNGTAWSGSLGWAYFGGDGNMWGTAWTPADINNSGFGVWNSVGQEFTPGDGVFNVDAVTIQVFYTGGGGGSLSASNTIATSGKASLFVLKSIGASGSSALPQSRTTQAFGKSLLSASRAMQASGNTFSTTSRLLAAVGKMIETASRPMQVFGGSGIESASAPVQTSGKSASQANAPLASIGASVTTALRSISSWGIGSLSTLRGLGTSGSSTDSASRITRSYGSSLSTIALGIGAWGELPPTPSKIEYWPYIGGSSLLTGSGTETNLLPGHYVEATVSHDEFVQIGDLLVSGVPEHVIQTIVAHHRANEFTVRFTNMGSYPETFTWSWQRRGRLLYYGRPGRDDADQ